MIKAMDNNHTSIHAKPYNGANQNDSKNTAEMIAMYTKNRLCRYNDLKNWITILVLLQIVQ